MRIPRVYIPDLATEDNVVTLEGQAAKHLLQVLRVTPEQMVTIFDGSGIEYSGVITATDRASLQVQLTSQTAVNRESNLSITLIQTIARGDRMDWVLQKATELGVTRIIPMFSHRSTVKLDSKRLKTRMQHWHGILIHACEQCGRNRLPELLPPLQLAAALEQLSEQSGSYYLEPNSDTRFNQLERSDLVNLFIGPEGGFDDQEKILMSDHGVRPIHMGPRILRTETAGIAAISALGALWGDM